MTGVSSVSILVLRQWRRFTINWILCYQLGWYETLLIVKLPREKIEKITRFALQFVRAYLQSEGFPAHWNFLPLRKLAGHDWLFFLFAKIKEEKESKKKFLDSVAMVTICSGSCISYFSSKVSISHVLNSIQYGISLQCVGWRLHFYGVSGRQ